MSIESFLKDKPRVVEDYDFLDVEILQLMADGNTIAQISELMRFTVATIETRKCRMYKRLKLNNAAHAIAWGFRNKIIE